MLEMRQSVHGWKKLITQLHRLKALAGRQVLFCTLKAGEGMPNADGYIRIDTKIDNRGAKAGLNDLMGSLKGFAAAVGIAFGVAAIVRFGKACIDAASDLAEAQNVVDVTFGEAAGQIDTFAAHAAEAFGLSELAAKKYTGTMGAMLKSMGFATNEAAAMSIEMAGLAGDMASFYNLSSDEAFEKIRSGISGETEPLKQLGINLSQANLEAYALAEGFGAGYNAMSEQMKALVRYNYLLSTTADAQGDFARTSDSWANQVRILQLQFESLKATLGGAFIAVLTPVLRMINRILSALNGAATVFAKFIAAVTGKTVDVTTATTDAAAATDALTDSTAASGAAAEKAGKQAKKGLANFDELNVLSGGSAGAGAGEGFSRGGGGGISDAVVEANKTAEEELVPDDSKISAFFDRYKGQIAQVRASWDELKTTVGGIFDRISAQAAETDIGGAAFSAALSALYAILEAANLVIGVVGELLIAFNVPATIESALLLIGAAFQAIGDAIDAITPGVMAFVETGLVPIAEWIGGKVRDAFAFLAEQLAKIGDWYQSHKDDFTSLGQAFGDAAAAVWDLIEPMADAAWEAFKDAISAAVDGLLAFSDWCLAHQDTVVEFVLIVGSFAAAWVLVNGAIVVWNTVAGVATGVTGAFGAAVGFLLSPIGFAVVAVGLLIAIVVLLAKHWDEIKAKTTEVWNEISTFIDGILDGIGKFFTDTWDGIKQVWGSVKAWFTENVITPVQTAFDTFKTKVGEIWDSIGLGIKTTLNGIITGIESFVNAAIRGINWLIEGLNSLLGMGDGIAEFLGFDGGLRVPTLSEVSLPRIKLAKGAVIPPNREFAAILGDQKSGINIETPLATMLDAFRQALSEMGGGGTGEIVINVVSELDGKVVARNQARYLPNEQRRIGGQLVKVGG